MKKFDDSYYILGLIKGEEITFNNLYNKYCNSVYKLAFRFLKNKELSEEVVQETFLKLWLNREKLDPEGNLWLYLYVIAKRLSLNNLRALSKSNLLTNNLINSLTEIKNETEENIISTDLEKYAQTIVNRLPKQQKIIFNLSRTDGLTHSQIAEKLDISPNTVKNHMVQALKKIKSELKHIEIIVFFISLFDFFR